MINLCILLSNDGKEKRIEIVIGNSDLKKKKKRIY